MALKKIHFCVSWLKGKAVWDWYPREMVWGSYISGTSLAAQWVGLRKFTTGVWSLVGALRPWKSRSSTAQNISFEAVISHSEDPACWTIPGITGINVCWGVSLSLDSRITEPFHSWPISSPLFSLKVPKSTLSHWLRLLNYINFLGIR